MAEPDSDEQSTRPEIAADSSGALPSSPPDERPSAALAEDDELYEPLDDFYDEEEGANGEADGEQVEWFDEQGRRHLRRAAPEGTQELLDREIARETGLPDRMERWRQRSATGAVVTAFALGLQGAFEMPRPEPAIIMETSGDPPTDLPVEAQLEQLGPRQSTVLVRQWVVTGDPATKDDGEEAPTDQGADAAPASPGAPAEAPDGQAEGEAGAQ